MPTKTTKTAKTAAKASTETKPAKKTTKNIDISSLKKDTRLISIKDFDWNRVVFSAPIKTDLPDKSGRYYRIKINYMYDDKTVGPAIVEFSKHYCYGVQPDNIDKDGKVFKDNNGKEKPLGGYKVPIVMSNQTESSPETTPEEQAEIDFLDEMRSRAVQQVFNVRDECGNAKKSLEILDDKMGKILYRGSADKPIPAWKAPTFYTNLIWFRNNGETGTKFYGPGDREIDPLTIRTHCNIYPTIQFDSIFIGSQALSVRHFVYDATVEPIERAPKRRLARTSDMEAGDNDFDDAKAAIKPASKTIADLEDSDGSDDDDDDSDDAPPPPKTKATKPVKKSEPVKAKKPVKEPESESDESEDDDSD